MSPSDYQQKTVGILGGGQLGRMLIQAGIDWNINFLVLDSDSQAPCHAIAEFEIGNLTDYNTVIAFGEKCEIITIEIENVNVEALKELVRRGKKVFPQPEVIELIQDKRTQKKFYQEKKIPTVDFILVENAEDIKQQKSFLPAVNKLGKEGYDGRGVQILKDESELFKAFDKPGLLEKLIDFEKEISVIVARNEMNEVKTFPAVEMVFHPEANLVEYLISPATISQQVATQAEEIAKKIITELNMIGLLAVEMFVTKDQQILVNEIAPRPHNSGHQTIEGNITSQYQQHLRSILNLPLGNTAIIKPSAMVNLLGEEGFSGEAKFQGLSEILKVEEIYVHLYGKKITKPFRKMGHVTILDDNLQSLIEKVKIVKQTLKIKS